MHGTNIFYVSDDPHFSAKHFNETIKYQVKDITPFDTDWLAIEKYIKVNGINESNECLTDIITEYAYSTQSSGILPEFNLPGIIKSVDINETWGYYLSADGSFKMDMSIIKLAHEYYKYMDSNYDYDTDDLYFSVFKSTIIYDWGEIEIAHIPINDDPYTNTAHIDRVVVMITKTVYKKTSFDNLNNTLYKNRLIEYISKTTNNDTIITIESQPNVHNVRLHAGATMMMSLTHDANDDSYITVPSGPRQIDAIGFVDAHNKIHNGKGCIISTIANNTIIAYKVINKADWIQLCMSTGELLINDRITYPIYNEIKENIFQIELLTHEGYHKCDVNITYDFATCKANAIVKTSSNMTLDHSVFIDALGMLKSSAMKMISRKSKEFRASKIPLINQITESYKQVLDFDQDKDQIQYPTPNQYYTDSTYVNQTLLSINEKLTGIVTTYFSNSTNVKFKHYKNSKSTLKIQNIINNAKIENTNGYCYNILNQIVKIDNILNASHLFDANNTYLLYNNSTNVKFEHYIKGKSINTPDLIGHEIVYSHPIIKDTPIRTIPENPLYTNGFKWDYIGFIHTGSGKYFTDKKQYGAIHDLNEWLFPLTWIYNRLTAKYENIDLENITDNTTLRDFNITELVKDFNINEVPVDYYIKFRKEFEEKFMNNSHGQKADRIAISKMIDDRYGLNKQVVNQFYGWVWDVLWKCFNSNTSFHRFVDAIIRFGVPMIIEAYYVYDYEGDGFQRFHMDLISEISKEIKSKFIIEIDDNKYHNRNIIIYNSYFRKNTLEKYHNYFGRQFSRVTNIFTVKMYNELLVDQKRVTQSENDPAWLNYFNYFYNNYDFDILLPYKDNVIKRDEYYIDKREDGSPYKIYTRLYPKKRGIEFSWSIDSDSFIDALYAIEDNYSMRSDILHSNHKLIPVNYSHHDSIHIMQNKIWFDDYSIISGCVERLSSIYDKYGITNVGYIMRNELSIDDYLSIDTLPANAEIFLNLKSLNLSMDDDINATKTFFDSSMNPSYKKYNRLNAIIHNINELSTDYMNEYNSILLKYMKRFMLIFEIRDGKLTNREMMPSVVRKAMNLFSERLVIYLNCQTEEDYLIGRIIAQRLLNLLKIDVAINIVDHVLQNKYTSEINFKYNEQPDSVAINTIFIKNHDNNSIISIYKSVLNNIIFINGLIDGDVAVNGSTTGEGVVNLIELMNIINTYKNKSEIYITGKIDNTLVESVDINVIKL